MAPIGLGLGLSPSLMMSASSAVLLLLRSSSLWLDPSDLRTLFQEITGAAATTPAVVDDPVGTMLDKSGLGRHAVAPSTDARPILRSSGGRYWLEFDGNNDRLKATFAFTQPLTRLGAYQFTAFDGNYRAILAGGTDNSVMLYQTSGELRMFAGIEQLIVANPSAGTSFVAAEVYDGASSRAAVDFASYTNTNPGTQGSDGVTLADQGFGGAPSQLKFGGCAQFSGILPEESIALLRGYYSGKTPP